MNLETFAYVAECERHKGINGSIKNLLWSVAYLLPEGERRTDALKLATLIDVSGDSKRTVQRSRDFLSKIGVLGVDPPGGRIATYELLQLHVQGRLFGLRTPGQDDKLSSARDKLSPITVSSWHPSRRADYVPTEIRSDQIRSDQIRSDQIRSDQIRRKDLFF